MIANVKLNVENTNDLINLLDGLRKNVNKKYVIKSKLIKKVGAKNGKLERSYVKTA